MSRHRTRSVVVVLLGTAVLLCSPHDVRSGTPPQWTVAGEHVLTLPVGVRSVAATYVYDVNDVSGNIVVEYGRKQGTVVVGGTAGDQIPFFYDGDGTWSRDEATGRTRVVVDAGGLTFDVVHDEQGRRLEGTYEMLAGFGGAAANASGAISLTPVPFEAASDEFSLQLILEQKRNGKVKAVRASEAGTSRRVAATLSLFDSVFLDRGKVKGKVKVGRDGATTGKIKVKGKTDGRRWSVLLEGPVDETGFRALADVRTPLIDLDGVPVTLAVTEAPDAPPPPAPPPPPNQVDEGTADVAAGQVTITRGGVPKRFFGKKTRVVIELPTSVGEGSATAVPATASIGTPVRFVAEVGTKVYDTANQGSSVELDVLEMTLVTGQRVTVRCTGTATTADGDSKPVDIIVVSRIR